MLKKRVIIAFALLFFVFSIPVWANPFAEAAYDARVAEGGKNATKAADKIKKAVIKDKSGNPAQAAYDARVKEGGVDTKISNNQADKIYQAVVKKQSNLADALNKMAAKFSSPEVTAALDTIDKVLGYIPEAKQTKLTKHTANIIKAYQAARCIKEINAASTRHKNAKTDAEKQKLSTELAFKNLELIDRLGGSLETVQSNLVSIAVNGAIDLINKFNYRNDDLDLILAGLDEFISSEYRPIVVTLMKNNRSRQDIQNVVKALETVKKVR